MRSLMFSLLTVVAIQAAYAGPADGHRFVLCNYLNENNKVSDIKIDLDLFVFTPQTDEATYVLYPASEDNNTHISWGQQILPRGLIITNPAALAAPHIKFDKATLIQFARGSIFSKALDQEGKIVISCTYLGRHSSGLGD